jgi:hypothetical protein
LNYEGRAFGESKALPISRARIHIQNTKCEGGKWLAAEKFGEWMNVCPTEVQSENHPGCWKILMMKQCWAPTSKTNWATYEDIREGLVLG